MSRFDFMYEEEKKEPVKWVLADAPHSSHYKNLSPEPIEIIEAWGLDFHLGNAVKYIARASYKGSRKEDLEKAIFYLQRKLNEI